MKLRCQPGDRCMIIGDVRGCECNIGATITVVALAPRVTGIPPAWTFKDVSRPLRIVDFDRLGNPVPGTECYFSDGAPARMDWLPVIFDQHLMPLRGEGEPDLTVTSQEKSVTA